MTIGQGNIVFSEDGPVDPQATESPAATFERSRERAPAPHPAARAPGEQATKANPRPSRDAGQPAAAEGGLENVLGTDDRKPVPDASRSPWRRICHLAIRAQNGEDFLGTGWLIGPRAVATAGHCLYLADQGGWAESIDVTPGLQGDSAPFATVTATRFRTTREFAAAQDPDNDYGVIHLDEDLTDIQEWFPFAALSDQHLLKTQALICGYPSDLPLEGADPGTVQYYHERRIKGVDRTLLRYEIDTYPGMSGSPVLALVDGNHCVIGIHTMGDVTRNSGTRIRGEVFENLRALKNEA